MKLAFLVIALFWHSFVWADEIFEKKRILIENAITQQITAFLNRDAEQAWSFAHPVIKMQFRSPERFMRMASRGYAPLFNFTELDFSELEQIHVGWHQTLFLRDESGGWYELHYRLEETNENEMLITGVAIEAINSI